MARLVDEDAFTGTAVEDVLYRVEEGNLVGEIHAPSSSHQYDVIIVTGLGTILLSALRIRHNEEKVAINDSGVDTVVEIYRDWW